MHRTLLRRLTPVLLAACCPALLAAAEPASEPVVGPVITLPTIEVRPERIRELDREIRKLDKLITRESKKIKSGELDRALNNAAVANAAAIFGGNSAAHLSAVAATRVRLMESERVVLEGMKRPRSQDELVVMEEQLQQLRLTRRNLDDDAKQR